MGKHFWLWAYIGAGIACRDELAGPQFEKAKDTAAAGRVLKTTPELTFKSGATFMKKTVTYLGSSIHPQQPQYGESVTVRHYLRVDGDVPSGYRFFAHLLDARTHKRLKRLEKAAAPLEVWPKGKIIEAVHSFRLPTHARAMQLFVGFWNGLLRLPLDAPTLSDRNNRAQGPRFQPPRMLPEYHAPRALKAPTIDGKLDDEAWRTAPAVRLQDSFTGKPVRRETIFRALWDDAFLYFAFWAEDRDIWGTFRKKDAPIYTEDVVEVFIDADGDGATYNELQVSPHNVQFDASFAFRRSNLEKAMRWESGMRSAVSWEGTLDDVTKQDVFWAAELAVPLKNLTAVPRLPPRRGDKWRFNAYRIEHLRRQKQIEGHAFSPLFEGDFHALPRFGWFVFH